MEIVSGAVLRCQQDVYFCSMIRTTILISSIFISCSTNPHLSDMLSDRPEMMLDDSSEIITDKAEKILEIHRWDSASPEEHKRSEFTFDNSIRVRKGMDCSEAWTVFFYESYNIENTDEFKNLYKRAIRGEMTREEWVFENAKLEHAAADKFIIFAEDTLIPYFRSRGMKTDHINDYVSFFSLPVESWMMNDESSYPWNYWGKYYDTYMGK